MKKHECKYCQGTVGEKESIEITEISTKDVFFLCHDCFISCFDWNEKLFQVSSY